MKTREIHDPKRVPPTQRPPASNSQEPRHRDGEEGTKRGVVLFSLSETKSPLVSIIGSIPTRKFCSSHDGKIHWQRDVLESGT